jgi:predicted nucleic acid-binding protein
VNERRGRITAGRSAGFLAEVDAIGVVLDAPTPSNPATVLARKHDLTVYDAVYLELAMRNGSALATLDAKLAAATRAENVACL